MKAHHLSIPVLAFAIATAATSAAMADDAGARLPQTASSYGQDAVPVPPKADTVPMKAADKAATFSSNNGFGASIFPAVDNYAWWKDR